MCSARGALCILALITCGAYPGRHHDCLHLLAGSMALAASNTFNCVKLVSQKAPMIAFDCRLDTTGSCQCTRHRSSGQCMAWSPSVPLLAASASPTLCRQHRRSNANSATSAQVHGPAPFAHACIWHMQYLLEWFDLLSAGLCIHRLVCSAQRDCEWQQVYAGTAGQALTDHHPQHVVASGHDFYK